MGRFRHTKKNTSVGLGKYLVLSPQKWMKNVIMNCKIYLVCLENFLCFLPNRKLQSRLLFNGLDPLRLRMKASDAIWWYDPSLISYHTHRCAFIMSSMSPKANKHMWTQADHTLKKTKKTRCVAKHLCSCCTLEKKILLLGGGDSLWWSWMKIIRPEW